MPQRRLERGHDFRMCRTQLPLAENREPPARTPRLRDSPSDRGIPAGALVCASASASNSNAASLTVRAGTPALSNEGLRWHDPAEIDPTGA